MNTSSRGPIFIVFLAAAAALVLAVRPWNVVDPALHPDIPTVANTAESEMAGDDDFRARLTSKDEGVEPGRTALSASEDVDVDANIELEVRCRVRSVGLIAHVRVLERTRAGAAYICSTDEDGHVAIPIQQDWLGSTVTLEARASGYEPDSIELPIARVLTDARPQSAQLVLQAAQFAWVRVVDPDGNPLPGVIVEWMGFGPSNLWAQQLSVVSTTVSGEDGLTFHPAHRGMYCRTNLNNLTFVNPGSGETREIVHSSPWVVQFDGELDPATDPPVLVDVRVGLAAGKLGDVPSDDAGRVELFGLDSNMVLDISHSAYTLHSEQSNLVTVQSPTRFGFSRQCFLDGDGNLPTISLQRGGFRVILRSTTEAKIEIEQAMCWVESTNDGRPVAVRQRLLSASDGEVVVRADQVNASISDDLDLLLYCTGYEPARIKPADVLAAHRAGRLEVALRPREAVSMRCVDSRRSPVVGSFLVRDSDTWTLLWRGKARRTGQLPAITPIGSRLHVGLVCHEPGGFGRTVVEWAEVDPSVSDEARFEFTGGSITVSGCPAETTDLVAVGASGATYGYRSVEPGRFRFESLPPDHYFVGPRACALQAAYQFMDDASHSIDFVSSGPRDVDVSWQESWSTTRSLGGSARIRGGSGERRVALFAWYSAHSTIPTRPAGLERVALDEHGAYLIEEGEPVPAWLLVGVSSHERATGRHGWLFHTAIRPGDDCTVELSDFNAPDARSAAPDGVLFTEVDFESPSSPVTFAFRNEETVAHPPGRDVDHPAIPVDIVEAKVRTGRPDGPAQTVSR
ncbi:MAG: hypothetical protein AAF726_13625 [Planctomycetota bacterium]